MYKTILTEKEAGQIGVPSAAKNTEAVVEEQFADPANRARELLTLYHSMPNGMAFEHVRELALQCADEILAHWLPEGEQKGAEYVSVNPTRQDSGPGSFKVRVQTGVWADFATEKKGGDLISLIAYLEDGTTQTQAAAKILEFLAGMKTDDGIRIAQRAAKKKNTPIPEFTVVMPIPDSAIASRPTWSSSELGKLAATWEYRNADGEAMLYVHRFNSDTGKTIRPQTYCKDATGQHQWKSMAPPSGRPAYGLDRLAARPDAPVIFTEGEKAADAAQRLFPDFVAVTTMGGAMAPDKTDFRPFAGRSVYIAPDNDEVGTAYKDKLLELLAAVGAVVAGTMKLDMLIRDGKPLAKGYDLADAEADGWTPDAFASIGEQLWEPVCVIPAEQATDATAKTRAKKSQPKKTSLDFANEFAASYHARHVACFNNQILAYKEGYWAALNTDFDVKRPILLAIGNEASVTKVNGVFELLKIQYAAKPDSFDRRSPLICLNNGTLDPIRGELLPHNAGHFLTNKLDISFNPEVKCPLWLQTLDEIFLPDPDKAEKIQLLQEFIGYCLIPDTRIHRFLWLVGAGGNGKSLILSIITALVGKENISYAQIERLQEKFVRAELQGKLVNISSEMSAQATVADGYLKQITAGDIIEAERKNEKPFSFKPYARLVGATNVLPRLLDHSDGFFRRAMIVRLNRQFKAEEQDKDREAKLHEELAGILNWAIAGLQSLLARGDFVLPASAKEEVDRYRVNSDPVRQFADDFLFKTSKKELWVGSADLYNHYKEWNAANGNRNLASTQFAERLVGIGFEKTKCRMGKFWNAYYYDTSSPLNQRPEEVRRDIPE